MRTAGIVLVVAVGLVGGCEPGFMEECDYCGNGTCADGLFCSSWSMCTKFCSTDDDCRRFDAGYVCDTQTLVTAGCVKLCESDADCPKELSCSFSESICVGSELGGWCGHGL